MNIRIIYVLTFIILFTGCIYNPPYPKTWSTIENKEKGDYLNISGQYMCKFKDVSTLSSDGANKLYTYLSFMRIISNYMHPKYDFEYQEYNENSECHLVIEQRKCDTVQFNIVGENNKVISEIIVPIESCTNEKIEFDETNIPKYIANTYGFLGFKSNYVHLYKTVGNTLIVKRRENAGGLLAIPIPLIPFLYSNTEWISFPSSVTNH